MALLRWIREHAFASSRSAYETNCSNRSGTVGGLQRLGVRAGCSNRSDPRRREGRAGAGRPGRDGDGDVAGAAGTPRRGDRYRRRVQRRGAARRRLHGDLRVVRLYDGDAEARRPRRIDGRGDDDAHRRRHRRIDQRRRTNAGRDHLAGGRRQLQARGDRVAGHAADDSRHRPARAGGQRERAEHADRRHQRRLLVRQRVHGQRCRHQRQPVRAAAEPVHRGCDRGNAGADVGHLG